MARDLNTAQLEREEYLKKFLNDSGVFSVDDILEALGMFYQADRAYIFRIDEENGVAVNTHEWCAEGVEPQIDNLQSVSLEGMEDLLAALKKGGFALRDIETELDPDSAMYRVLLPQNIRSLIFEPLLIKGQVTAFLGVDNPSINQSLSLVQFVVSMIFSSRIDAGRSTREEEESHIVLSLLCEQYVTLYYVDFASDYMRTYKTNSDYSPKYGATHSYSRDMGAYIMNDIAEEDRVRMRRAVSPEYVMKRFRTEDSFEETFTDISFGDARCCRFRFIKANEAGTCAVICGSDITAQRKEEDRRKEELETMQAIIASSDMGTWRIELPEGKPPRMLADARMMELLGIEGRTDLSPEEIYHAWFDRIKPEALQSVLDSVERMKTAKDENTYLWIHPELGERYVRCGGTSVKLPDGYLLRGYHYDVDDIVREDIRRERALKDALDAAEHANRAKSTFLSSMSHDIRTPMNAIIGFTALAQAHIDDRALVQDYLAKISTSGTHLLNLINDILDMSRIESGTVKLDEKPVHIPDLLHDLRTMVLGLVNAKNQNLYIDTQDIVHEDVITDRLRLNQVMINIVGNAVKYTQSGGDIIIRLREIPGAGEQYSTYEFSVKDNGIGMSKEFREHLFESFVRERSSSVSGIQGSGLGMAITKNIVDMMGGTITVQSEPGRGSKFTVTLKLRPAGGSAKMRPIGELVGARALVVDDDLDTCRSVSKMLREIQMRPDWTSSGREAVIRAQDAAEMNDEYRVFIIDYLMPDMNGIEVVRRIRRVVGSEIPIIVLTAYDWSQIENEAREAGVTAFVSKPLFMSELRSVLTRQDGSGEEREQSSGAEQYDYSGRRVLLVEDNELNREIATSLLESAGLEVDTAEDGMEAVDIMSAAGEDRYDLIFMDIQMPRMDGYTATREIRTLPNNRKANIPIVAMTANAFEEDRKKSLEAGMNGHIVKPIHMKEIAKVLDSVFADGEKA